jgi:hypothetical protein
LFFNLGCAALGDDGCEVGLEGKGDEVVVVEESGEEVVDFRYLWGMLV